MDIIIFFLIFFLGFIFVDTFKSKLSLKDIKNLKFLWVYHLIFGIYVCFFVPTDGVGYWQGAKNLTMQNIKENIATYKGTEFMYVVHYFPSNYLDLSYFSGTMIYTLLGFIGICIF